MDGFIGNVLTLQRKMSHKKTGGALLNVETTNQEKERKILLQITLQTTKNVFTEGDVVCHEPEKPTRCIA